MDEIVSERWMDWHQPCPPQAAIKILQMVHELHRRGYHHIHASIYMRPTGAWYCSITSAAFLDGDGHIRDYGDEYEPHNAIYSTSQGFEPFGWQDGKKLKPKAMAVRFANEYPQIVHATEGTDYRYVGWFVQMVGLAEDGFIPYSVCDEDHGEVYPDWIPPMRQMDNLGARR